MTRIKQKVVFPVYCRHKKTGDVAQIESFDFGRLVRLMQYKATFCFQYCDLKPMENEMILKDLFEDKMPEPEEGQGAKQLPPAQWEITDRATWLNQVDRYLVVCQKGLEQLSKQKQV